MKYRFFVIYLHLIHKQKYRRPETAVFREACNCTESNYSAGAAPGPAVTLVMMPFVTNPLPYSTSLANTENG